VDASCSGKPRQLAGPEPTGNSRQREGTATPDGEDARPWHRKIPRPGPSPESARTLSPLLLPMRTIGLLN